MNNDTVYTKEQLGIDYAARNHIDYPQHIIDKAVRTKACNPKCELDLYTLSFMAYQHELIKGAKNHLNNQLKRPHSH